MKSTFGLCGRAEKRTKKVALLIRQARGDWLRGLSQMERLWFQLGSLHWVWMSSLQTFPGLARIGLTTTTTTMALGSHTTNDHGTIIGKGGLLRLTGGGRRASLVIELRKLTLGWTIGGWVCGWLAVGLAHCNHWTLKQKSILRFPAIVGKLITQFVTYMCPLSLFCSDRVYFGNFSHLKSSYQTFATLTFHSNPSNYVDLEISSVDGFCRWLLPTKTKLICEMDRSSHPCEKLVHARCETVIHSLTPGPKNGCAGKV